MDQPFIDLIIESLNLTHPRFASADGLEYAADEADGPLAARKEREQSFIREFHHQFRSLWDKALPVKLGLGHVVLQADPAAPAGRRPDFLFWQLGEKGQPDRRLGAVSIAYLSNSTALEADLATLARYRTALGYPFAVQVAPGRPADVSADAAPDSPKVTRLVFDVDRWVVRLRS